MIEDISYISLRLTETDHVFLPFRDRQAEDGTFYLQVRGDPESAFAAIRAAGGGAGPEAARRTMLPAWRAASVNPTEALRFE